MRTAPAGQTAGLAALHRSTAKRVYLEDPNGDMQNMSAFMGVDWLDAIEPLGGVEDEPVSSVGLRFKRAVGDLSLAPLMQGSEVNRDELDAYAPFVNPARRVEIQIATMAAGVSPATEDWAVWFRGTIDNPDFAKDVSFTARDYGAKLVDTFIEEPFTVGADDLPDLAPTMQALLDEWVGEGVYTIKVVGDPDFGIVETEMNPQSLMEALQTMAGWNGWNFRFLWDDAEEDFVPTLYEPARSSTTPVRTISPDEIYDVSQATLDQTGIRNAMKVLYTDDSGATQEFSAERADSIATFGRRFMLHDLRNTAIQNEAQAERYVELVLDDTESPNVVESIECALDWRVELGDIYEFEANGKHYDTNQIRAVVGHSSRLVGDAIRTTLQVRGKPSGGYLRWLNKERTAEDTFSRPDRFLALDLKASPSGTGQPIVTSGRDVIAARCLVKTGARPTRTEIETQPLVALTPPQTILEEQGKGNVGDTLRGGVIGYRNADGTGGAIGPVYADAPIQAKPLNDAPTIQVNGYTAIGGGVFVIDAIVARDVDHAMDGSGSYILFHREDDDTEATENIPVVTGAGVDKHLYRKSYVLAIDTDFWVSVYAVYQIRGNEYSEPVFLGRVNVVDDGIARISGGHSTWALLGVRDEFYRNFNTDYMKVYASSTPIADEDAEDLIEDFGVTVPADPDLGNQLWYESSDDPPEIGDSRHVVARGFTSGDVGGPIYSYSQRRLQTDGVGFKNMDWRLQPARAPWPGSITDEGTGEPYVLSPPVFIEKGSPLGTVGAAGMRAVRIAFAEEDAEIAIDDYSRAVLIRERRKTEPVGSEHVIEDADGNLYDLGTWIEAHPTGPPMLIPVKVSETRIAHATFDIGFSYGSFVNTKVKTESTLRTRFFDYVLAQQNQRLKMRAWAHDDPYGDEHPVASITEIINGPDDTASLPVHEWRLGARLLVQWVQIPTITPAPQYLSELQTPVRPGDWIALSVNIEFYSSDRSTLGVILRVQYYDSAGVAVGDPVDSPSLAAEDVEWRQIFVISTGTHEVPAGAHSARIYLGPHPDAHPEAEMDVTTYWRNLRVYARPDADTEEQDPSIPATEQAARGASTGSYTQSQQRRDFGDGNDDTGAAVVRAQPLLSDGSVVYDRETGQAGTLLIDSRTPAQVSGDISSALSIANQALDGSGGGGGGGGPEITAFETALPVGVGLLCRGWRFAFRPTASGTLNNIKIQLDPAVAYAGNIKAALFTAHATEWKPGARVQLSSGKTFAGLTTDEWTSLGWALTGGVLYWLVVSLDNDTDMDSVEMEPLAGWGGVISGLTAYFVMRHTSVLGEHSNPWAGVVGSGTTYHRPALDVAVA